MKKSVASAFAVGLLAAGFAVPAQANDGDFTWSYGCEQATFTNKSSDTIGVNYGSASSDDAKFIEVPAGQSRTVTVRNQTNFGFTASDKQGTVLELVEYPGVDLTAKCTTGNSNTTKAPQEKTQRGGLAKTGL